MLSAVGHTTHTAIPLQYQCIQAKANSTFCTISASETLYDMQMQVIELTTIFPTYQASTQKIACWNSMNCCCRMQHRRYSYYDLHQTVYPHNQMPRSVQPLVLLHPSPTTVCKQHMMCHMCHHLSDLCRRGFYLSILETCQNKSTDEANGKMMI